METKKKDTQIIKTFVNGAIKIIKNHHLISPKALEKIKKRYGLGIKTDIASVVNLSNVTFKGSIGIFFPKQVVIFLIRKMLKQNASNLSRNLENGETNLGVKYMTMNPIIILPFATNFGIFHIESTTQK